MISTRTGQALFWVALLLFLAWDFVSSPAPDLRSEPPLIALGSGTPPSAAHCALPP